MKNFTSSTPVLLSFAETNGLKAVVKFAGDRLTKLSRTEKYQLSAVISLTLWGISEDAESPALGSQVSFEGAIDELKVSANVKFCILILASEFPETLAVILPAINAYAKEDDRFIKE